MPPPSLWNWSVFRSDSAPGTHDPAAVRERRDACDRRRLDAWQRFHPRDDVAEERLPLVARASQQVDVERRTDERLDIETRRDRPECDHTADEQSRADEQHQRQRDFDDDERLLEIETARAFV
jgi:hypothetical protein